VERDKIIWYKSIFCDACIIWMHKLYI